MADGNKPPVPTGEQVKDGILLVGYGTRKGNLVEVLESQASRIRAMTQYEVGVAYFRVSKPSIPEAIEAMAKKGVDRIVAVPYYIAEGKLTHVMIPEKMGLNPNQYLGEVDAGGRKVTVYLTRAFNFSTVLTDIICDRIRAAGGNRDSGILILGHGTLDQTQMNRAVVERNAQRLAARGYSHTVFSFNEFCEPAIKDALAELESQGVKDIVAIPLFIAMGLHLGEEIPEQIGIPPFSEGGDITVNGRTIKVRYTRPMEDDPRLTDLVMERAGEFLND